MNAQNVSVVVQICLAMPTSLKWGALVVAILDSLLQVFASFYLLYRLLSIFALVMAAYDSIVVFTFTCKTKVFNGILGLWQFLMVFYSGMLISQWFNLALFVSISGPKSQYI